MYRRKAGRVFQTTESDMQIFYNKDRESEEKVSASESGLERESIQAVLKKWLRK